MTSVGINLAATSYWSTEEPFLDRFKTSGPWKTYSGNGTVQLDDHGYPLGIPAGEALIRTSFAVDPASASPVDTYVMTFSGTATIKKLNGATILSRDDHSITFQVANDDGSVSMEVDSMSASDPMRDIHVVRTDQLDLFNQGAIFNPAFLAKISQFDTLRFMDWEATNETTTVSWDARTLVDDASWARNASSQGVPVEIMVELANQAHSDMWYNVPTRADDAFVRSALDYIHEHLDPTLKVHVEYSNEMWNSSFDAYDYGKALASNVLGVVSTTASSVYYGYRAAQVADIAKQVFGADANARLVNVLAAQSANADLAISIVAGVATAGLGVVSDLFTDYAIAPYFGLATSDSRDRSKILSWAQDGETGLAAAFNEIENGGTLRSNRSVNKVIQDVAEQAQVAHALGLNLVAYEGGSQMSSRKYSTQAQQDVATAFFTQIANDSRMNALYTKLIGAFDTVGGNAFNAYNDIGMPQDSGYWGALSDVYQDHSPRYDALMAALHGALPDVVTGSAQSETLTGTALDEVFYAGKGDDILFGGGGQDIFYGGVGNDTLYGGLGHDKLFGETGNDVYVLSTPDAQVVEGAKSGTDTVQVLFNAYVLPDNIEKLVFNGSGSFTGTGNAAGNTIIGGSGNDRLYGLAGNDKLQGGGGNDVLDGDAGADTLTGGSGADRFVFNSLSDIASGSARDVVNDFSHAQGDLFDLSGIDANSRLSGNQAFTFLGAGAFTGHAGELHFAYDAAKDMLTISGDTNGDRVADFSIYAQHVQSLVASDFLL